MRDSEHFARALAAVPVRELKATLVRRVPLLPMMEAVPVDFLFTSGKAYRYNPRGVWCVYFAEDEVTAAAEYGRHNTGKRHPFATYFAEVRMRRVIDLCDAGTVSALGLTACDLKAPWVGARKPTATQILGQAVNGQTSVAAIRFPSDAARTKGFAGANVVIFRDCVRRPDLVHILGPTKKPLQKWP
jgi:hypothetical protein